MEALTNEQIRRDNPHFGPEIRLIEEGPYQSNTFDFTQFRTVGAHGSDNGTGGKIDAWASYLWSPTRGWCLGAN